MFKLFQLRPLFNCLFFSVFSYLSIACVNDPPSATQPVAQPNQIIGVWAVSQIVIDRPHPRFEYLQQLHTQGAQLILRVNPDGSGNFELSHIDPASQESCRLRTPRFTSVYCCPRMRNIYTRTDPNDPIESESECFDRHFPSLRQGQSLTTIIQRFLGGLASDSFHFTHTSTGIVLNPVDFSDDSLAADEGTDRNVAIHLSRMTP